MTADVSEQMRAAEALARSESLYRFLAERSSDVMWKADLNLKFTFVSSAVERLFGYSVEEALTHSVDDVVTTDTLNKILTTLQDSLADPSYQGRPCIIEGQMRRRDGKLLWVDITIVIIRNQAGEPVEIQGTTRDISARKEVEERLRVSEQQYRLVVENAADVVVVTDLDLHPLFISPSVETVAGYTVEEAMALPLDQIMDRQSFDLAMAVQESELAHAATAPPATNRIELRMAHKDGRPLLLEANSRFLRQTDGTVFGLISVLRDITKRREAEDALRESEQRYRMVVENIVDVVVVADLEMTPSYVSPSIERVLGYTVDEAMVLGAKGILTVDSLQYVQQTMGELLALGPHAPARTIWAEVRARRKFGSTVLCESHSRFLRHSDGTPYGVITLLRDANERREMDEKLRESEQRYRLVVENVVDIVMVTDLNLQPTFVSPSVSTLLGYSPEELLALPLERLLTPSSLRQVQALNQTEMAIAMIEKPTTTRSEIECYHKNGTIVQFETHSRYLRRANGRPYALISVWRDLTERRKAEQAVRESEAKYRLLAENMADTIWIMDMDMRLTYVSPAVMRLCGYTVEEALAQSLKDHLTPESLARLTELLATELPKELAGQGTPGATWTLELEASRKDGTTVWTEQVIKFLRNSEGVAVGILGVSRDITERRQAAEALRESESKYRLLAENAADLIWTTDITFRFTYVSPSVERVLGYTAEEASRRPVVELLTPSSQQEAAAALADEMEHAVVRTSPPYGSRTLELEMVRRDGTTIWTENTLSFLRNERHEPVGVLGVTRDISERKRAEKERRELEDRLNHAQKMEAVGRLAGGVAHDFNNILTGITGYTEMLLASLRPADPLIDDIEEIRKSAGRASALTAQLLAFSRKQTIEPRVLDLNALIHHTSRMLRRLIGEDVELQFLPGSDLGRVRTDPVQVEQILVNLAVNARDAMPNGGRLSICTANVEVDAAFCHSRPDAQPGEYVVLTVEDNGCGMSPEVQQHLFEPFFTTKPKGKGTGLGLSTIYGIVQQNRGFLTVRSEVGNGTSWRVYFPREHADIDQPSPEPVTAPPRGSETILLVEDEEMLRNLVRRILERQGYQVLSASGGQEAVAEAKRHPARIDLLLTDVIMPDANGKQVYEQLRLQRPDIKVLFMSGYTGDAIAQHGLFDLDLPFIQKPFTIRNLAARVREILDS